MDKVRIGVVGIGNMGFAHAKCIYGGEIEGLTLTAVCDINSERLSHAAAELTGVKTFENYEDLLNSDIADAVIIAVPHPLHSEIAIAAFERGLHVLVEKPVDITVSKAKKLNESAEKSGKVFCIMFNQRTSDLFAKAREIVKSGELGELKRSVWIITNWYRTQGYYDSGDWRATWCGEGGGVLLNQAPHNLDLWQWICGMPKTVRAVCDVAKYHNIEVEDDATLYTRYENGATGVFITSTGEYPGTNRLEIIRDKGKIVLEQGILKWWLLEQSEREACFSATTGSPKIPYEYQEFSYDENQDGHTIILQNFANAILHGESLVSPGRDGILQLELSNAAYLSEWLGNSKISLPMDSEMFDSLLREHCQNSIYQKKEITSVDEQHHSRWQVQW